MSMEELNVDTFLEHYGVKGMKWGVRKADRRAKRAAKYRQESSERARKRKAELATPKGKDKDEARTQKYMDKYGIDQKAAQRRQRTARTNQKKVAKGLAKGVAGATAYYVGVRYVADLGEAAVSKQMGYRYSTSQQAASTRLINNSLKTSMKAARAATKGARMVWDAKQSGKVTYMPPGSYIPGNNPSASVVRGALSVGQKALERGR